MWMRRPLLLRFNVSRIIQMPFSQRIQTGNNVGGQQFFFAELGGKQLIISMVTAR